MLVGIEAEPTDFRWLAQHFRDDELDDARRVRRTGAMSLATFLAPLDRVDLVDADINGVEADARG